MFARVVDAIDVRLTVAVNVAEESAQADSWAARRVF